MEAKQHAAALDEVSRDIAALEDRIRELRLVAEYHRSKAHATVSTPQRGTRFAKGFSQSAAAKAVLSEVAKPMKTHEIARCLIQEGYPATDDKKLKMSLFTTMTRQKKVFDKAGRGLWKLKNTKSLGFGLLSQEPE